MGVLVGTSLIVIIPEGIEAIYTSGEVGHLHTRRSQLQSRGLEVRWLNGIGSIMRRNDVPQLTRAEDPDAFNALPDAAISVPAVSVPAGGEMKMATTHEGTNTSPVASKIPESPSKSGGAPAVGQAEENQKEHDDPPTFYIGLSLITGFIIMFLIDKLPRHASEHIQPLPPTRHISLDNLSQDLRSSEGDEESESFLQSLTPSPKQTRSLATTTGLVIHAAADGIAMGASASSSNTNLGFIVFVAIMVHKAPAAFGLTSVLLKQGLSKRAARGHLIIFSLAAPFGALTTWILVNILGGSHMEGERGQWWTGMLLLFSAGTFL
jgi:zinc transporter 9